MFKLVLTQNYNQGEKMENQEILKAIATLADKVSRFHERVLATERDNKRLEKTLSTHLKGCSCHDKPKEIATRYYISSLKDWQNIGYWFKLAYLII